MHGYIGIGASSKVSMLNRALPSAGKGCPSTDRVAVLVAGRGARPVIGDPGSAPH
jgi:hypothetical protein